MGTPTRLPVHVPVHVGVLQAAVTLLEDQAAGTQDEAVRETTCVTVELLRAAMQLATSG